jgi:hypothetical protein
MIFTKLKITLLIIASIVNLTVFSQQLKIPVASPFQSIKQAFALSEITIEYSRPSVKGRVVFGDVVAFGKVWRTGANSSTKIIFGEDIKFQGIDVKAGTYALYTIPNKDTWEIMLYKDLTLGGNVADYKIENEILRVKVPTMNLVNKTETFTINFTDLAVNSCNIELAWDNTKVNIPVLAEIDSKIMKSIENTVINDNRSYFQAATYYYENNKDLKLANEWVDKAIKNNPTAYWIILLKAKIQLKLNDKKGAGISANQVLKLATEDKDDAYIKQAEKIIVLSK